MKTPQPTILEAFQGRIGRRLVRRLNDAFSFMVATAWATLFDDIFTLVSGERDSLVWRFVYAIAFTILAVIFTMFMDRWDEDEAPVPN